MNSPRNIFPQRRREGIAAAFARFSQHSALSTQHSSSQSSRRPRRGFTFLEVLFSVIIIGIGFVMIAAIFPVAIQQSQANVSEAAAVAMGRDAFKYLQSAASAYTPPAVGANRAVAPIFPATANPGIVPVYLPIPATTLNQLPSADRRFGWTGFYRRDAVNVIVAGNPIAVPLPYAQVAVITGQSTAEGQATYGAAPYTFPYPAYPANPQNQRNLVSAYITVNPAYSTTGIPSTITFANYAIAVGPYKQFTSLPYATDDGPAAPGAFVLVLWVGNAITDLNDANAITGWYARLGARNLAGPGLVSYYLQSEPPPLMTNPGVIGSSTKPIYCFVLGRPLVPDPSQSGNVFPNNLHYFGPPQDITCVSSFIAVNNCN